MKKPVWRTPSRMEFNSGHKTFDRQVDLLDTGNVWGRVQLSQYIRPHSETRCNGRENKPGKLRAFDLSIFKDLPRRVTLWLKRYPEEKFILYEIRHWVGKKKTVHCYIVTDTNYKRRAVFMEGPTYKSWFIMQEVRKYIVDEEEPNE